MSPRAQIAARSPLAVVGGYILPTAGGRRRAGVVFAIIMIGFFGSFVAFFAGFEKVIAYATTGNLDVLAPAAWTVFAAVVGIILFSIGGVPIHDACLRHYGVSPYDIQSLVSFQFGKVTDVQLLEAATIYTRYITVQEELMALESSAGLTDAQKGEVAQLTFQLGELLSELRDVLHPVTAG